MNKLLFFIIRSSNNKAYYNESELLNVKNLKNVHMVFLIKISISNRVRLDAT